MRVRLAPGTPTGKTISSGFRTIQTPGGGRRCEPFREVVNTYTPSPEARGFRERRAELRLTVREAARRMGLRPGDVFDLETGEQVPADPADWPALIASLEAQP